MSSPDLIPVSPQFLEQAYINKSQYLEMYQHSIDQPEEFWRKQAKRIDWIKPFTQVKDTSFASDDLYVRWFHDGTLNVSANCIDRHLALKGEHTAIHWEPDTEGEASRNITYQQLHKMVCQFANGLRSMGVKKGDVVTIYMPMVPEAIVSMLACARIGAVHSVVFGGFSPEALAGRIDDGNSTVVITADQGRRAGSSIPLKDNVDQAVALCRSSKVEHVVVLKHHGEAISWLNDRDVDFLELCERQASECPPEALNAEDPLFILYTSGSTGQPKGVQHSCGGYITYASLSHQYIFDYRPGDIYWCMADIGWITGHSYAVYGPLANGATMVMFEGVPNYPDSGRLGRIIDKYSVNQLYTAPTAIRALMANGKEAIATSSRSSLKLTATAGEPINPEAWTWFHQDFGNNAPIMDTWWQTETGGVMITPLPGVTDLKPGSATRPFFGIRPELLDNNGKLIEGPGEGYLVIADSWPGQMRTIFGDHDRFIATYFSEFEGYYATSDGARRDADGDYWITGRVDDVLNVSGHRMGTAEIESALSAHQGVTEAAVVGVPHAIKGEGIYVYVSLSKGYEANEAMRLELKNWLRKEIGPIAAPDCIQWAEDLPKTRSGKIMRRILRKIATHEYDSLGDTSTLADPSVVSKLIKGNEALSKVG